MPGNLTAIVCKWNTWRVEENQQIPTQSSKFEKIPLVSAPKSVSESKSKLKLSVLSTGIVLLLILATGVLVFLLSKKKAIESVNQMVKTSPSPTTTQDEIANWKVYTNTTYKLKFDYPVTFDNSCCSVSGPLTGKSFFVYNLAEKSTVKPGTDALYNGFSIFIDVNQSNISLLNYIDNEKKSLSTNGFCGGISKTVHININGQAGTQIACINSLDEYITQIPNSNEFLIISRRESQKGSFDNMFNQILSTFKFTN